jgi:hypothetical protein
MRVTGSLHLTSTVLTVNDFEHAVGLRADYHWGKGDHAFSPKGRHMDGFQADSHSEFDLFEGRDLPSEEVLEECARGLSYLRDLFAKVRQEGGSAELRIRHPIGWSVNASVPIGLLSDVEGLELHVAFELSSPDPLKDEGVDVLTPRRPPALSSGSI